MSSVSSAMRRRASGGMCSSVRMLCRRSASLTSSTRTSSAIASRSLRRFSACLASLRDEVELLELGQALDQGADVLAEQLVDLGAGGRRVLDRVVQQRRRDGGVVELEVGQDRRDFERMGEIRVAGGALLLAMRLHGVDIGAVEQRLVGVGIVAADALDQLVLPHHLRRGASDFIALFNGLRDDVRGRAQRRPGPRLVLHPRQIGRERAMSDSCRRRIDASARRTASPQLKISRRFDSCRKVAVRRGVMQNDAARACGPGRCDTLRQSARRALFLFSSGCSSGGARPSRPLSSSSSVMRSTVTSVSSASTVPPDAADQRHGLGLRLVDLDVFLQRMDQLLLQIVRRNRRLGDLAQRHDRVLVVVALDRDRRRRTRPCARDGSRAARDRSGSRPCRCSLRR